MLDHILKGMGIDLPAEVDKIKSLLQECVTAFHQNNARLARIETALGIAPSERIIEHGRPDNGDGGGPDEPGSSSFNGYGTGPGSGERPG